MDQNHATDAFRDRLAESGSATGRPELAHQSLGRPLSETERAFAAALMEIYGAGVTEMADVARALTDRSVTAPSNGGTAWTEDSLLAELETANASLDAAYQDHGYGA